MTPEQKERMEFFRKHSTPHANQDWFSYSPDNGFLFFSSKEEAKEYAIAEIDGYCQDTWDEEVEQVSVGKVSLVATQANVQHRPPQEELDEEGCDKNGRSWGDVNFDYRCDYKLRPPANESEKAVEQQGESPVDALMEKVQAFAYAWARYDRELSVSGSVHGVRAKVDAEQLKKELHKELEQFVGGES
ncbi:hypothetical protein ACJJIE_00145 (plasmid) [Microbulbifer sp. TRSA001]|uniref:hypothetical protein n=1 Tax=Microbulbifer sp. TRSA001 TaxID=3243381 RepID=UPI00403939DB